MNTENSKVTKMKLKLLGYDSDWHSPWIFSEDWVRLLSHHMYFYLNMTGVLWIFIFFNLVYWVVNVTLFTSLEHHNREKTRAFPILSFASSLHLLFFYSTSLWNNWLNSCKCISKRFPWRPLLFYHIFHTLKGSQRLYWTEYTI